MATRTTITNGVRLWRYPVGFVGIFLLLSILQDFAVSQAGLVFFCTLVILFVLLYKSRRVRFDDAHIYRMYGKNEKATAFTDIVSIKRSAMKLNGTRMWKVTFLNADQKEKKFWFLEGVFQHGSTQEFIKLVQAVNPSVVVWQHPHFNHPAEKKD